MRRCVERFPDLLAAVKQTWHIPYNQGQILAMAFRQKSPTPFVLLLVRSEVVHENKMMAEVDNPGIKQKNHGITCFFCGKELQNTLNRRSQSNQNIRSK